MFNVNETTAEQESNGVWAEYGAGRFKIAHTNNMRFQREISRLQAPYRKKIDKGILDPQIQLDIMCKSMAKGILLDWKDVGDGENEIPFSEEVAIKVLTNNSELREFVQDFALDLANFREEEIEDTGKS